MPPKVPLKGTSRITLKLWRFCNAWNRYLGRTSRIALKSGLFCYGCLSALQGCFEVIAIVQAALGGHLQISHDLKSFLLCHRSVPGTHKQNHHEVRLNTRRVRRHTWVHQQNCHDVRVILPCLKTSIWVHRQRRCEIMAILLCLQAVPGSHQQNRHEVRLNMRYMQMCTWNQLQSCLDLKAYFLSPWRGTWDTQVKSP